MRRAALAFVALMFIAANAAAAAYTNFPYSRIATAPSPATSGTSFVVTAGQGALFPTPPFQATVWAANAQPLSTNAEVVTVTVVSTDTFTITRAREGSTARSIITGDQIAATITAQVLSAFAPNASPAFTDSGSWDSPTFVVDAVNHRVGIGTATPQLPLHVLSSAATILRLERSGENYFNFGMSGQITGDAIDGLFGVGTNETTGWVFKAYNGGATFTALAINNVGNVGIGTGTAAPTSKLQVVGLPTYSNNTAALAGGLTAGAFYVGCDTNPDLLCGVH